MTQTRTYRMKLSTYKRFRKEYPAVRGESVADYFERLSKYLGKVQAEWEGYEK